MLIEVRLYYCQIGRADVDVLSKELILTWHLVLVWYLSKTRCEHMCGQVKVAPVVPIIYVSRICRKLRIFIKELKLSLILQV